MNKRRLLIALLVVVAAIAAGMLARVRFRDHERPSAKPRWQGSMRLRWAH